MTGFAVDANEAARMIAQRGPRWAVQIGLRGGKRNVHFADTAERAEEIYSRHIEEGGYLLTYTQVYPPAGSVGLAALGLARRDAKGAYEEATSVLRAAVLRAVEEGRSEAEIAREAGVDRMTVRTWCGKR
jgi:DNA-directed RNA polymerase specialized sigma24 family protein